MTRETWFDLASLTKVLVTLPCVLLLVAEGELDLAEPVAARLPAFRGNDGNHSRDGKATVTVGQLLTHTSGLPPHRELWLAADDPAGVVAAALAEPLAARPGSVVTYSDLGFITLGALVEQCTGARLDEVWRDQVAAPLGLRHSGFRPPGEISCASTEPPPAGPDRAGVVHDENARAAGGVAGHAGLFGTADDVATYVRTAWLDLPRQAAPLLPADLRAEAVRCQTEALPTPTAGVSGRRGLGWVLRGDPFDHAGERWPATGVGHTGFTGTCVELDPASGRWVVLLTNAVHAGRERPGIVALRRQVHDLLDGAAGPQ